jgi:soluble lytic murein transglycosylase-like protein
MRTTYLAAHRTYAALRGVLALFGAAVLAAALTLPLKGEGPLPALFSLAGESFDIQSVTAGPIQVRDDSALEREQRAVTELIAKRYRGADSAAAGFVESAYRAGAQHHVDPLLILAVMAIESRYNPVAESSVGAKGLMQVIPKYHLEKLADYGGEQAVLEPDVNIQVGARVLREYQRRFGDVETALQMYAGALDEPTTQYATKVLAEKARLDVLRVKARRPQTV